MSAAGDAGAEPAAGAPARIPARDGFELAASLFDPEPGPTDRGVVVISSAATVKRAYYDDFARFLAAAGFAVVSYDYRGQGESRPARLRGFRAAMHEWGELDLAGVLDFAAARHPGAGLAHVGHSIGAAVLGLAPGNERLRAVVSVGGQNAWWRYWPSPWRYAVGLNWFVIVPVVSRLLGYFPGIAGIGELPAGVALEWARWCRSPHFISDPSGRPIRRHFETVEAPMLLYSFGDDDEAPRESVDALAACYTRSRRERRHLEPADLSARRIGHFGFFRARFRDTLWRETLEWLARA